MLSFLLASSADDVDEQHIAIEDLLIKKYSWRNNSFTEGITAEGIRRLLRDIETIKNKPTESVESVEKVSPSPTVQVDDDYSSEDEYTSADESSANDSFITQPPPSPKNPVAMVVNKNLNKPIKINI